MWELGWAWDLFSANYPEELRKVESLWPLLEEEESDPDRRRLFEDAAEAARAELPPPPEHWNYPRLVLAEPPMGRFPSAVWHQVVWEERYRPIKPLTGFRRIAEAIKEDIGSQRAGTFSCWRGEAQREASHLGLKIELSEPTRTYPRTRKIVELIAPRIGLLDPFRQDRRHAQKTEADLLPRLQIERRGRRMHKKGLPLPENHFDPDKPLWEGPLDGEEYCGRPLGEDLCSWVTAGLVVRFWDLAAEAAGEREKLKHFLERIPNEFGLDPEQWQRALEYRSGYWPPLDPISVLLREAVHLRLYGVHPKSMNLSPSRIAERLREWGILGVVTPGPFRWRKVPRRGADAGEPITGLTSSFHLALLDLAALLREERVLVCQWCGRSFTAKRPRRARYCSDRCRIAAHRHRKGQSERD